MVNDRSCGNSALCLAHHAKRLIPQLLLAGRLSLVAVAALSCSLVTGSPASGLHRGHPWGVEDRQAGLECLESGHRLSRNKKTAQGRLVDIGEILQFHGRSSPYIP